MRRERLQDGVGVALTIDATEASSENLDHYEYVMERFDRIDDAIASSAEETGRDEKLPYFRSPRYVAEWKMFDILAVLKKSNSLLKLLPKTEIREDLTRESQTAGLRYSRAWDAIGSSSATEQGIASEIKTLRMTVRDYQTKVLNAASIAKKQHESRSTIYKALSVLLYLVGWILSLRGRLLGGSDTE
jgi:hypothetical protein